MEIGLLILIGLVVVAIPALLVGMVLIAILLSRHANKGNKTPHAVAAEVSPDV